jgi:hypothetical protein
MAEADDLIKSFAEFMASKKAEEEASGPEPEVEIWDKEGNGARVPRSAAKGFLNKFGIDLDETPTDPDDGSGNSKDGKPKSPPAKTSPTGKTPTTTKYFGKRAAGK